MIELKPCPFCGGKAVFNTVSRFSSPCHVGIGFEIKCGYCGVSTYERGSIDFDLNDDGELIFKNDERLTLANKWNTRHKEVNDK